MYVPPTVLPVRRRTRDKHEKELHKAYEDKNVLEVYKLLFFEKEKELVDLILHIDYSW
jgi:hypothetical protein